MDQIVMRAVMLLLSARRSGNTERGATATEYAVMLGCLFLVIIVAATAFGQKVGGVMDSDHLMFPTGS